MSNKQQIQEHMNEIIKLKREIENEEQMREECFFRIDQLDLEWESSRYEDFRAIIDGCDWHIERLEDRIDELWLKVEELGGVYFALDQEIIEQDSK